MILLIDHMVNQWLIFIMGAFASFLPAHVLIVIHSRQIREQCADKLDDN